MCLQSIIRKHIFHGFKVGKVHDGKFLAFQDPTPFDEWQVATVEEIGCYKNHDTKYLTGFHVCPTIKEAKEYLEYIRKQDSINYPMYTNWKIFLCEYSGVMYRGVDESGIETLITSLIKISSTPVGE